MKLEIYKLPNGDVTIGRGAWILLRYSKQTKRIRIIDRDAPTHWIAQGKDLMDTLLECSKCGAIKLPDGDVCEKCKGNGKYYEVVQD